MTATTNVTMTTKATAESIIREMILIYRDTMDLGETPYSYVAAIFFNLTPAERGKITRYLNSIGSNVMSYMGYDPFRRVYSFVTACVDGVAVTFPESFAARLVNQAIFAAEVTSSNLDYLSHRTFIDAEYHVASATMRFMDIIDFDSKVTYQPERFSCFVRWCRSGSPVSLPNSKPPTPTPDGTGSKNSDRNATLPAGDIEISTESPISSSLGGHPFPDTRSIFGVVLSLPEGERMVLHTQMGKDEDLTTEDLTTEVDRGAFFVTEGVAMAFSGRWGQIFECPSRVVEEGEAESIFSSVMVGSREELEVMMAGMGIRAVSGGAPGDSDHG